LPVRVYALPMIFQAHLERTEEGDYIASCAEPQASAHGLSPQNALDSLRDEIRYCVELCPCSGVEDDYVELRLED
jgi:predicted RNase H-like HicB family nuclease